jgi:hypothetical protein
MRSLRSVLLTKLCSGDQIKKKCDGRGMLHELREGRGVYRILVGKSEGKRSLGRSSRRLKDDFEMGLGQVGLWGMDSIDLAQNRDRCRAVVKAVMNLRVP